MSSSRAANYTVMHGADGDDELLEQIKYVQPFFGLGTASHARTAHRRYEDFTTIGMYVASS